MAKSDSALTPDVVIFGAGIAGLWTFHRLKHLGYDVLLLESGTIGCGQTIAAQGILHSGLKFSLAGKVNALAQSISHMPQRWIESISGHGEVDLTAAKVNARSQHLLIPKGFIGGIAKVVTQKMLGDGVREIERSDWSADLQSSGFKGSAVFMDEPVLDVPSVLRALAAPYLDCIKSISEVDATEPFEFLARHNITPKRIIFTAAASNHSIAQDHNHASGLETQKRPLMQVMMNNAPFPLFAHLVGKTDKPVASITTHSMASGDLVWYIGGGVAEKPTDTNPEDVFVAAEKAIKSYMPSLDLSTAEWAALPINRVEGKSKTDTWMPDTPTVHHTDGALYCWPTKLTFAPMLSDFILEDLAEQNIQPAESVSDYSFLANADFTKTPWDSAQWTKLN